MADGGNTHENLWNYFHIFLTAAQNNEITGNSLVGEGDARMKQTHVQSDTRINYVKNVGP